ncbi:MAG: 50S ribosomal protein L6 [Candidatus Brocadiae bacterium]|nr:50S ribosomal protein L6 [Candidatus Brocadiia bacterium]
MSRIGQQPIPVPEAVEMEAAGNHLKFKGKLGELEHRLPDELEAEYLPDRNLVEVRRKGNGRRARSLHGLHRTLIANKIEGVSQGFSKALEIYGTGYSVNLRGKTLVLQVGFCHEVTFEPPESITVEIEQNAAQLDRPARFVVKGIDKELVGHFAASVRAVRPPEPYKGKGIRYQGEYVRRKQGKAFTGLER